MKIFLFILSVIMLLSCGKSKPNEKTKTINNPPAKTVQQPLLKSVPKNLKYFWHPELDASVSLINQISTPKGFQRVKPKSNSFAQWLQFLPLFPKGQKVRTFNGSLKWNQQLHERVINIDIGKRDLQQCADAVMRLRSEYLFSKKEYYKIHFNYTNGTKVSFNDWRNGRRPVVKGNKVTFSSNGRKDSSYKSFKKYLIQIFSYAGTASLEKEMKSIPLKEIQIGDVLIQGGHPGHAVIVVDMAKNEKGEKLYLLAQSYMPAQNIHILKNPIDRKLSPWFKLTSDQNIHTPEWDFTAKDLKRF